MSASGTIQPQVSVNISASIIGRVTQRSVHDGDRVPGFPIFLPWWSFAIGVDFSPSVGIIFGLFPAVRATGLNPIEALRCEQS